MELNRGIKTLCEKSGARYVDLHALMADAHGDLDARYTIDGVHLNGSGYQVWRAALLPLLE
jgi:lysophospholipase L1-like esterase